MQKRSQNKQTLPENILSTKSAYVFNDFRDFLATGNIINFAVGILVGNALSSVIQAFITDLFDPIISKITGKSVLLVNQKLVLGEGQIVLSWGHLVSQLINFFITAIAVYLVIRMMQKTIMKQNQEAELTSVELESQILAELKQNNRLVTKQLELDKYQQTLNQKAEELKQREELVAVRERFAKNK